MALTRRTRKVNKRLAKVNEEWPVKDVTNSNKSSIRKRKSSDMLGSQWSKEELERFYESYRKHGKDWRKVSGTIRNRSIEMVEALYNMNRAYLSLPEGTVTAAGLIAMMTNHYDDLEGSESERESNDVPRTSRKPPKRGRGKFRLLSKGTDRCYPYLLQYQPSSSSYGCLSLLKKKHSEGSRPRAVGKRTPRIPVSNMADRDKIISPYRQGLRSAIHAVDDEGAHVAALALAEVSQRGALPQVSRTPVRRYEHARASPVQSGDRVQSEMANFKTIGTHMEGDCLEGSLGSREAENGDFARDVESAGPFQSYQRTKKLQGKRPKQGCLENDVDDDREACSGTEEGLATRNVKDGIDMEMTDVKTAQPAKGSKKRSRQLFFGDESSAFDALQTLADLSVNILLPASTVESESSVQVKEEKGNFDDEQQGVPESMSTSHQRDKSKYSERKDRAHSTVISKVVTRKTAKRLKRLPIEADPSSEIKQETCKSICKTQKRKRKSLTGKLQLPKTQYSIDAEKTESQKAEQMATSSQQEGPSRTLSSANAPQSQESSTDLWPEVAFNLSGGIIGGKTALKNRCLALLKTQIGLAYDDWRQVEQAKKDAIWDTLFTEFKMPADQKDEVLKEMGMQLNTWRRNLCSKYFGGLDSDGIKALKDKVPEKEKIPLSQWNEFIKREASEAKINQRGRAKGNRAKKTDIHCLGRMSYAEKTEEMMRKDPLRRLPERSDVFIESRRQKKTGEFHPKVAEEIQKLTELKSSQEFLSQTTLENDALSILYGKDTRGRTRGVGPVPRSIVKAVTPIRSEIEKAVKQSNVQVEQDMCEIKQSLNVLIRAYSESQRFPPHHSPPQPGSLSNPSNPATPSHPTPASSLRYDIFSLSNTKKIATGVIALTATPGTVVHGHVLLEYERKVKVIDVVPGEEQQGLYLGSQGCATTIKETEGGWVVWPIWLLH